MLKALMAISLAQFFLSTAVAIDHSKVVGPESCLECHENAGQAWQQTHHFKTFQELHKSSDAKGIADKMGVKRIKNETTCAQCHYTVDASEKPMAGISCESCHGAANDWVKIHNDYGGKTVKKEQETPDHKQQRIAKATAAGQIRPEDIYSVARNCYQCHTVPNEKLVEVGGHKAGSDFELVSWSQGEIRHTFAGGKNQPASAERKRLLYVTGRVLDLEYGLRGVAEVTQKNGYAVAMAKRVASALEHVNKIKAVVPSPEIGQIADLGKSAQLKPNNKAELLKTAESVSSLIQKFLKGNDGKALAAVDALIPKTTKGTAVP